MHALFLQEKQKLLDEIEELTLRLRDEQEKKRKMRNKLSQERHQFQRDKEATQEVSGGGGAPVTASLGTVLTGPPCHWQLIEDLRRQLEHLQLFKLETEQRRGRSSSAGLQEYHTRARESELEQEVRRLKQVCLRQDVSVGGGRGYREVSQLIWTLLCPAGQPQPEGAE